MRAYGMFDAAGYREVFPESHRDPEDEIKEAQKARENRATVVLREIALFLMAPALAALVISSALPLLHAY
jgi:hypothetical protein